MENTVVEIENEIIPKLTILEYHKNQDTIKKLNISDLRGILKYHKKQIMDISKRFSTRTSCVLYRKICNKIHDFTLVGNKNILLERVKLFFKQNLLATCIQKCIRGYFVRLVEKLHGPAWSNRDVCTNTSDFCTLEPLNEISRQDFVSYADLKYGTLYSEYSQTEPSNANNFTAPVDCTHARFTGRFRPIANDTQPNRWDCITHKL